MDIFQKTTSYDLKNGFINRPFFSSLALSLSLLESSVQTDYPLPRLLPPIYRCPTSTRPPSDKQPLLLSHDVTPAPESPRGRRLERWISKVTWGNWFRERERRKLSVPQHSFSEVGLRGFGLIDGIYTRLMRRKRCEGADAPESGRSGRAKGDREFT